MNQNKVIAILIIILNSLIAKAVKNNVCKTLKDYATIGANENCWYNPDVNATTEELATNYGFVTEKHFALTEDGYMIKLYRLFKKFSEKEQHTPILLQYGVGGSPQFWMLRGNDSLAFQLCNQEYDVWLSNIRGSFSDATNEKFSKTDHRYWNYSFHELGIYDLPTMTNYIAKTGRYGKKIIYIGHSMGTTLSYVYAIERKEHAEKHLQGIISLAPVTYLTGINPMIRILSLFTNIIYKIAKKIGIYSFGQDWFRIILFWFCSHYPGIIICDLVNGRKIGSNLNEDRPDLLPVFFSFFPTPTPIKVLAHYGQIATSNKFQQFDFGAENKKIYNSVFPPQYNISKILIPIHLFVGKNDDIASIQDNNIFYKELKKNGINTSKHLYKDYAHNDFFMARNYGIFFRDLLKILKQKEDNDGPFF